MSGDGVFAGDFGDHKKGLQTADTLQPCESKERRCPFLRLASQKVAFTTPQTDNTLNCDIPNGLQLLVSHFVSYSILSHLNMLKSKIIIT